MILLLLIVLIVLKASNSFVSNHSFVFVTGWPQSGTSLVQQFLTSCPNLSTMVEKCELLLGKRCINWNHEGQWLLRGTTRQFFNSGAMCPSNASGLTEIQKATIMDEWKEFWSLDQHYLAEKSPQSLLKTGMLRQLVQGAKKMRILVVLKNPVTLNIATPKGAGWKHYRGESAQKTTSPSSSTASAKKVVSRAQSALSLEHFIDFMTHDRSNSSGADCSLGWLPAMDTLHRQLLQDANSTRDIRIVRYEQFERPNPLCRAIFAFLLDSNSSSEFSRTASQVCDAFFPLVVSRVSASTRSDNNKAVGRGSLSVGRDKGPTPHRDHHHHYRRLMDLEERFEGGRSLRLRNYQDTKSFSFIPELVTAAGQERVQDFLFASLRTSRAQQLIVDDIERRLGVFGNSTKLWRSVGAGSSVFAPWEFNV